MTPDRTAQPHHLYLTFDDGPDPVWTPRVLDLLAQFNARGTFFMIGQQVRAEPALARRVLAAGHAIGNHTWSHRHPWTLSPRRAAQEVAGGSAAIADVLGTPARFFRPPHGRWHPSMSREARHNGELPVLWTRTALDWGHLGTANAISRRLDKIQRGDIVLMHDAARTLNRPEQLLRVLPSHLASWKQRGLIAASLEAHPPDSGSYAST